MSSADIAERLLPRQSPTRQGHPRPALETPYVEAVTELERSLAVLWTEFVGVAPIGVNDNLFELGGDSLTAIQLLTRVRGAYEVEIHPTAFFKSPTIAELAVLVETRLIEEIEDAESLETPAIPVSASA
jgi:phthiocerol/phenolphthiocerol synthesis type-I polyketide synthase E